jgi:hypothetical protein
MAGRGVLQLSPPQALQMAPVELYIMGSMTWL